MKKLIKARPLKKSRDSRVYDKITREDQQFQEQYELTPDVLENEASLKSIFNGCSDVVFRSIKISGSMKALVVYIEGMVDSKLLDNFIFKQLLIGKLPEGGIDAGNISSILDEQVISLGKVEASNSLDRVVKSILDGKAAVFIDGDSRALIGGVGSGERRDISEPVTEAVIRGPREGFTEDIVTNISLIRRRLKTSKLKIESLTIGEMSNTDVAMAYIKGVAEESVIDEARERLSRIKIDGVLESGYIEEFIEDEPYSPFPLVQNTERPDVVAANLLEGKIAIFTDNTPFVLMAPVVFWGQVHSNEDYYERFTMALFIRWIRLIYMFVALLVPSLYVAVTTFHQQMIPPKLLMNIIDAREPTPFPAFIEALIMEITFEALREAGLRLPKPIGQAVSIVGALVIGQASVQAGLVSAPMVIVVSLTGIASFTIPRYNFAFAVRVLRFPLIFLAGALGLYGVTLGVLGILIHLVSLRSFGVPYFSPVSPFNAKGIKDVFMRAPWWDMNTRPELTTDYNGVRVPVGQKPQPGQGKGKQPEGGTESS